MKQKGIDFALYVNTQFDEFGPEEYNKIAGQRGASLSMTAPTYDITSKDEGGWMDSIGGAHKEWSVSSDGLHVFGDESFEALESAFMTGTKLRIELKTPGGTMYSGFVLVTEMSLDLPYDDLVTYSIEMVGCGALVRGLDVVTP